jgi:hypothetical protein
VAIVGNDLKNVAQRLQRQPPECGAQTRAPAVLTRPVQDGGSELDELLRVAQEASGTRLLDDDFSILKMTI